MIQGCAEPSGEFADYFVSECAKREERLSTELAALIDQASSFRLWLGILGWPLIVLFAGKVVFWIGRGFAKWEREQKMRKKEAES
ncbi:MAG: hypothetical protein HC869_19435 [Rhodospirillales bacterium]|nr:hypothetical protein [Rhodospirillales bacterium]